LQELSVRLMQTQDNERRRISRELHDSVGQYLAHAKMSLESLKRPDATEKETQSFEHLLDTLDKCLTETRTISYLLHPPLLDELGLSSAVHWYVEGFSERSGIQVKLNFIPHELTRLPGVLELALFRILQESLTNIHRHTHSQSVDIQLKLDADEIALEVRDYGQGMPSELLEGFRNGGGKGIGLRSMNERASELGGRLEIQSDKNGTLVRVTAPLSDAATKSGMATGNPSGT
jgi:signal transduction histidine kinase